MFKIKAKHRNKHPFWYSLVRIMSVIEINILFGRALVRIRSKIEKNTLFGRALVRVRAKNREKHPFLVRL